MTYSDTRRTWLQTVLPIALIMLVGLALRLWFVSVNELQPTNSPADDGDYYQRALRFATTGHYIDDFWLIRPPLHVFLFTMMLRFSIMLGNVDGLTLIRGAQIVLSLIAIPIGYDLARRLFGRRPGFVFAGMLAVWYPLVELPTHLFTEPLFIMLLLLHLWLLVMWRDERRWLLLVLSGIMLGLTALTRSVGMYGAVFVLFWLLVDALFSDGGRKDAGDGKVRAEPHAKAQRTQRSAQEPRIPRIPRIAARLPMMVRRSLLFLLAMAAVILPWTYRNYVVYERFIPIDTIGSVNLWLHMEKYEEKGVEILKQMPQRDRHVFSTEDTMRMFHEDPLHFWNMLWRNAWLHFLHIWKAQFIEDFLLKLSFFGRPLRAVWPLGIAGDVLWFVFTAGSMVALAAPWREGTFRWVAIGWIAYTMLTVMLFHLEPRYLMPLWLMLMLYGAWFLGSPGKLLRLLWQQPLNGGLALVLLGAFLLLCFSYRNYPETLAMGYQRESHRAAGVQAYAAGDYATAVQELQTVRETQPIFVSSTAELAHALIAQGRLDEAEALLTDPELDTAAQHILLARGALAWAQGDAEEAAERITKAEKKAGDNIQRMAMQWLRPPATRLSQSGQCG